MSPNPRILRSFAHAHPDPSLRMTGNVPKLFEIPLITDH
jgi:hypothetical protein